MIKVSFIHILIKLDNHTNFITEFTAHDRYINTILQISISDKPQLDGER